MLKIDNLYVDTKDGKEIIKGLNLEISDGEIHVIMGPNGTGKSTLSKVIMGSSDYIIKNGSIFYNGDSINDISVDERARRGIFLSYQSPISIEGVSNSEFLKTALNMKLDNPIGIYPFMKMMDSAIDELKMDPKMLHRSINQDFSGGERKKNEILQMRILKPNFIMLDELDSGLDVDSLKIASDVINSYLKENPNASLLIITHHYKLLEYIKPHFVHAMLNGRIVKSSDITLAKEIEENGFSWLNSIDGNKDYE